jgi:flagellar basal-body rod protein FlgB
MRPIHLFELASQQNRWLAMRQTLVSGNIANANTPGYRTVEIEPFAEVLESTRLSMAATRPGHVAPNPMSLAASNDLEAGASWDVFHSGGNVNLEQEMLKASEINRTYTLNVNLMRSFHRMLVASAGRGGA